ncbi:zinc-ribbon domain-containing protein [Flavihumibacter sp. UBA7668]|uniref:zinc-ribbon domain-containing protein n=1 Tax=Flavihumibacter sp. UBA7668 TaxID=1946542 RepID=UPI0025C66021|nr:zinc-ribbon domain-containing protein [Flavihumibacter sp. UBA7668]
MDKCSNCGMDNRIDLYVFQKYAHVFWIPFFPIGKTAVSQCDHCKQSLEPKEMPPGLMASYKEAKKTIKSPFWMFSGLALLAILITVIVVNDKKKQDKNAQLVLTPKAGDLLEIKTPERQYTLYKIDQINGDSVLFRVHNYETNKLSGLRELKEKGETGFSTEQFAIHKNELKAWFDKGELIDIERN